MNVMSVNFDDRAVRHELSELLLTCPGAGAWVWNLATNNVTWSDEVYRIFEAPNFDHTLEGFQTMIEPDDMEAGLAVVSRALISRETFQTQLRVKTPKGRHRRVMNVGRAVYDKKGKPKMIVGMVNDMERFKEVDDLSNMTSAGFADTIGNGGERLDQLHDYLSVARSQVTLGAFSEIDHKLLIFQLERIMDHASASKLSATLLETFNDIGGVLGADRARLREVKGIEEKHIKLLDIIQYSIESILHPRSEPLRFGHPDTLLNYLRATHAYQTKEQFRVIFLNRGDHLIANEIMQEGTVDQTAVYGREIIKRALELSASTIVLVHNHPSGNPTPSLADLDLTGRIEKLAHGLGIDVRDHIIMGRYGHLSFRKEGLFPGSR